MLLNVNSINNCHAVNYDRAAAISSSVFRALCCSWLINWSQVTFPLKIYLLFVDAIVSKESLPNLFQLTHCCTYPNVLKDYEYFFKESNLWKFKLDINVRSNDVAWSLFLLTNCDLKKVDVFKYIWIFKNNSGTDKASQIDFKMLVTKFCSLGQSFISTTWIFRRGQSSIIIRREDSYR